MTTLAYDLQKEKRGRSWRGVFRQNRLKRDLNNATDDAGFVEHGAKRRAFVEPRSLLARTCSAGIGIVRLLLVMVVLWIRTRVRTYGVKNPLALLLPSTLLTRGAGGCLGGMPKEVKGRNDCGLAHVEQAYEGSQILQRP